MNESTYLHIENSQAGLFKKFRALRDAELSWYEAEALAHLGASRLTKKTSDSLIREILGKSPNDQERKQTDTTYYIANTVAFLRVMNDLLTEDFVSNFDGSKEFDDLAIYNYHRVFRDLLFDSLILLNDYSVNLRKTAPPYQCGKNAWQHTLTLYQSLRQAIFGQASLHSYREIEPDLAISVIRQIVELRARRALGIIGWYDPATDSLEPLQMKRVFEVIKNYESGIDFSVPMDS